MFIQVIIRKTITTFKFIVYFLQASYHVNTGGHTGKYYRVSHSQYAFI